MSGEFSDILNNERILMAAWMLPQEGPLTESQRRQAMANFGRYIAQHGLKAADVGRQLGSPKATAIGEMLKGTFRENADEHIRKLNMWIEQHARAAAANLTDKFVSTKVANIMQGVARLTYENRTMGLAYGPTGIGKTRCAQAIYETFVGSIYVRIIDGYHHCKGLTGAIAQQLNVRSHKSQQAVKHQMQIERVIRTLTNSNRLILIDEAHKLQPAALELLRDIHDSAGVPILLIATKDLHDSVLRDADPDHGQLYSRFDVIYHVTQGHDVYQGGKPLFTVADIKKLYAQPPVKLAQDAALYLHDVANMLGYGSLRRCRILLGNAARRARSRQGIAEGEEVTVSADDLRFVERRLRQDKSEQDLAAGRRRTAEEGA